MSPEPRLLEVRRNVLKQNDVVARALRHRFHAAGVFVVSLVSSPGSGKTAFLEKTLTALRPRCRVAALVGDLATENDAARLARSQAPVKQIITELSATWRLPWWRTLWTKRDGTLVNSISSSSRTWATWSALPPTTWGRIFAWCCCRSRRVKTSPLSIRQFSTAPTSLSSPKATWLRRLSSTPGLCAATFRPFVQACASSSFPPRPAMESKGIWDSWQNDWLSRGQWPPSNVAYFASLGGTSLRPLRLRAFVDHAPRSKTLTAKDAKKSRKVAKRTNHIKTPA